MLSKKIGIDLGTSTVLIYVKGEGIVVNEPSLVAVNRDGTRILAVGRQAFEMVGRAPDTIQVVRPMREGVIADFVVTEGMLHHFIGKVQGRQRIFKPEIMICVPSGVTSVERRAVTEAAISAGAKQAWLIDEPLAAAIGPDLPISEPRGNAICDIGGGTPKIAVISRSGKVVAHSSRAGGKRRPPDRGRHPLLPQAKAPPADRRAHWGGAEDRERVCRRHEGADHGRGP